MSATPSDSPPGIALDQKTMDVLVTNIIPTSKYFEVRFDRVQQQIAQLGTSLQRQIANVNDTLQRQIDRINVDLVEFRKDVDKRFEQVDKRFEQVDKRFEQVDKRFEQIDAKLDKLLERIDVKIDAGLRENRAMIIRLFSFTLLFTALSVTGMFAKMFHLF
ncbi:MAG: hypothetical protein H7838_02160 [Magnetococcus sp. DMHC-8]